MGPWLAWDLRVLGVLRLWAGVLAGPGRLGSWLVCRRAAGRVHAWGPGPGAVEIWCNKKTSMSIESDPFIKAVKTLQNKMQS